MTDSKKYQLLNYFIATVWLINGLFCKVLHMVPRHQEIVARILGNDNARLFTILIGLSEIVMLSGSSAKNGHELTPSCNY